jgi:hypothetical protein
MRVICYQTDDCDGEALQYRNGHSSLVLLYFYTANRGAFLRAKCALLSVECFRLIPVFQTGRDSRHSSSESDYSSGDVLVVPCMRAAGDRKHIQHRSRWALRDADQWVKRVGVALVSESPAAAAE